MTNEELEGVVERLKGEAMLEPHLGKRNLGREAISAIQFLQREVKRLNDENLAYINIFSAASDLNLSITSKEFAKMCPTKEAQKKLAKLMNEFEAEFLQADCRDRC